MVYRDGGKLTLLLLNRLQCAESSASFSLPLLSLSLSPLLSVFPCLSLQSLDALITSSLHPARVHILLFCVQCKGSHRYFTPVIIFSMKWWPLHLSINRCRKKLINGSSLPAPTRLSIRFLAVCEESKSYNHIFYTLSSIILPTPRGNCESFHHNAVNQLSERWTLNIWTFTVKCQKWGSVAYTPPGSSSSSSFFHRLVLLPFWHGKILNGQKRPGRSCSCQLDICIHIFLLSTQVWQCHKLNFDLLPPPT